MVKNSKSNRRPAPAEEGAMGLTEAFHPVGSDGFTTAMAPVGKDADPASSVASEEITVGSGATMEEIDLADGEPADGEGLSVGEAFADEGAFEDFYAGRPVPPAEAGRPANLGVISGAPTRPASKGASRGPQSGRSRGAKGVGRHARPSEQLDTAASKDDIPEYMRKSRRMRRILIVAIILLALVVAGLIYFGVQLFKEGNSLGIQQALSTEQQTAEIKPDEAQDASTSTAKVTTVPDLVSLLGLTQEEAVTVLQHGAQVSSTRAVNEEGNPIKTEARVALTAEPADSRTGTPTVYLGLDEAGKIIQAGYSASTTALGYGSLSFADAVRNEDIIQKTLAEAGVAVPEGAVELPEDSTAYTTVDSDGKTVTKEYCSFSGEADVEGASHTWSAVLSYDYSMANASGNLADTVRTIFIYVNA